MRGPRINVVGWDKDWFEMRLSDEQPDVMGFLEYAPHDPVRYFSSVHPTLPFYFREVTDRIGKEWDIRGVTMKHVFYSNAFVAKPHIYEQYVNEFLNPAMKVMDGMPELMQNSGYPCPLPVELAEKWGVSWYPLHTFICERLFSWWVHLQGERLSVKYY